MIIRQDDGTFAAVWGPYVLRSAFQPIFAFYNGRATVVAFEGLIRPSRDGEPVPPATFFASVPFAERLHVETLTRTLHLGNAGACLDPDTSIFVNFDPSVFGEKSVADAALRDMRLVLREAAIDPRRVVCEVTEQKSASEAALHRFVQALKLQGFRIAVDDYGSADSDVDRIRRLQPDIVKFDAQWITRLMETGPGFALLSTMVSAFAEQGIKTVFEGIEETWQLELAEKSGASMVQGYVLARPQIASIGQAPSRHSSGKPSTLVELPDDQLKNGRHRRADPVRGVFGRRTKSP
ncbi:EAL domain, c-di-GMP-specific phosphodiesterase class I (or its enzymatically inactive variant) [Mesorhizobium albiziae]|uniref:EAL domain, c-di-GMP-specific phosphodiesterase class I (Or its enzymatically inactive variant) n=1 Tax=Neomesorhizobium albiziae TaxID=335020 RepID=A0A1I3ZGA7_9HYPH|nr:EAL domain-containing protein [Mesorhizobium albiziae]GLS32201.1 diguanylate phosphodiesterase [Mesorhizobium albiziae]SFK43158.1 EAL domain, c-di-GMP-specific phosphodiesterase class I (or its enzymatically inactive variant) [Mesorhizobium albiziae]